MKSLKSNANIEGSQIGRRTFLKVSTVLGGSIVLGACPDVFAQTTKRISIATGGMGGVYFPLGGAIAAGVTKYVPGVEAAAEVTAASVDNCKLVGAKKADLGIVMGDTAYDAYAGLNMFKQKLPVRNLAVLYSNVMHVVAPQSKGIKSVADLKGRTISTGAPGSGVEVMALRILDANGINPDKDIKRDRLGASESAGALKDGKIEAFFWCGGVPTASVLDLAASPGMKLDFIPNKDSIEKMTSKHGPVYFPKSIPKTAYSGMVEDVPVAAVGNLLIANEAMEDKLVEGILAAIFDHKAELVAVHKQAEDLDLKDAVVGSPIPFHKAAIAFYKSRGLKVE